ncbi:hypothetical protein [Taibaiella soli]|uniref:DUF6311 domain-containing protein n=1 Tax=Taibaiella soli TaxID=1649169 RepID=A0A2W2AF17_9BACT|nr:hypothetical protein [Taibaiella soli]PZF74075.1 hypothetical protein DN068_05130 [Taibaiella soli]
MKNRRYLYLVIFAIHILISLVAFKDFRIDPQNFAFSNVEDGLKNTFTLLSYVKEPVSHDGIFKYNAMNYPFGEYVFYTDNTPLFSICFKWFCHHIYDLSDYTFEIFQTTLILGIILSGLLCFYIFRKLFRDDRFAFLLAVFLPWINMQVMRIWRGHFNLSYSFLILLAIAFSIMWYERREHLRKRIWVLAASVLLGYCAFFIHGYYLPIVTGFQAAILLIYGLYNRKTKDGKQSLVASVALPVITVGFTLATLLAFDKFYAFRKDQNGGYGWDEIKVHFGALVTSQDFYTIPFPLRSMKWNSDAETLAFLGNCGLFAALFMLLLILFRKAERSRFKTIQKEFFNDPLKASLFWAGLMMFSISIGETYNTDGSDGFMVYNLFNPFLYLHWFTNRVQQFRCLGRLAWPFFFSFYVWVIYTLIAMTKHYTIKQKWTVLIAFAFFGGMEIKDYVDKFQSVHKDNVLSKKNAPDFKPLKLDYSKYQAFVPIPYYTVGSEVGDFVLDDYGPVSLFSFQFQMHSKLPMMACKLSRTVPEQSHMLLTLFANDSLLPELKSKLQPKPVLVCYDKTAAADLSLGVVPGENRAVARDYYLKINQFPQRNKLNAIDSFGNIVFYEWYPKL